MKESEILTSTEATTPTIAGKVLIDAIFEDDTREVCESCLQNKCSSCLKLSGWEPTIPLTPGEAFKWWKWMTDKFYWFQIKPAIHEVVKSIIGPEINEDLAVEWFLMNLEPMNQIKVICLCAEKGSDNA